MRAKASSVAAPVASNAARALPLHHSHIIVWRQAREAGALDALIDRRTSAVRPKKVAEQAELERLRKKVARLE